MEKSLAWERLQAAVRPSTVYITDPKCGSATQNASTTAGKVTSGTQTSYVTKSQKRPSSSDLDKDCRRANLMLANKRKVKKRFGAKTEESNGTSMVGYLSQEVSSHSGRTLAMSSTLMFPGQTHPAGRVALNGGLTTVERRTVKFPSGYEKAYQKLKSWALENNRSLSPPNTDSTMVDYLDTLLAHNQDSGEGEKASAALLYFNPELRKVDLIRTARGLRGLRKAQPPKSRLPLVTDVVCGLAACSVLEDQTKTVVTI